MRYRLTAMIYIRDVEGAVPYGVRLDIGRFGAMKASPLRKRGTGQGDVMSDEIGHKKQDILLAVYISNTNLQL